VGLTRDRGPIDGWIGDVRCTEARWPWIEIAEMSAMSSNPTSMTAIRGPQRGKRYFRLEDANRAVPYVLRIVDDITACYRHAVQIRQRIEQPHPEDHVEKLKDEYELAMDRLNELLDELHQVGVELKDFEKGLIDFPSVHQGREVYLCWRRGDQRIESWHEVDAGYAGRQTIGLLEP